MIHRESWREERKINININSAYNNLPRPALEGGGNEQGEHSLHHVVVMEVSSDPFSFLLDRVVDVVIFVGEVIALAFVSRHLGEICASEEFSLEQLDSDNSEKELEEQCNHHNVADGFDGDNQTLDHLLQTFGSVDCSQGSQHTEDTKNLEETDSTSTKDGDERD